MNLGGNRKSLYEQGMRETIQWYVEHQEWWEKILQNTEDVREDRWESFSRS